MDVLNELRAQAEMMVLDANGRDGLSTCVLRASNPFGPGDDHFVPLLVAKAKSPWAKVQKIRTYACHFISFTVYFSQ